MNTSLRAGQRLIRKSTTVDLMLQTVFDRLLEAYGPQEWWPAKSRFEIIVGAVLTQNTNWRNVEKAIENLRSEDAISAEAIIGMPISELASLIRPAGFFRLKAQRLKNVAAFVHQYESLDAIFAGPAEEVRQLLLQVNGIGPETADSILLYAGGMPTFVVDAYTARVMKRHGWIAVDADYDAIKQRFESTLPRDATLFNEFHALIVQVGKKHCRPNPKCIDCPLQDLLPDAGPIEFP